MLEAGFLWEKVLPALNQGVMMSILLIIPSALLGFLLGVAAGALRVFGAPWMQRLVNGYVALFRGVPLLLQLYFLYYALPKWGIYLSAYGASITGFILCSGAYHSEYIRGALLSIKQGQIKAAEALGFSRWKTVRCIIIPQAMRLALPGCGNEIIYLIKYSSLAYTLTFIELTGQAKELTARTFTYIEIYLAAGIYYLIMTTAATWLLHYIERTSAVPGFGSHR